MILESTAKFFRHDFQKITDIADKKESKHWLSKANHSDCIVEETKLFQTYAESFENKESQ